MQTKSILQLAREALAKGLSPEQIGPVLGCSASLIHKLKDIEEENAKQRVKDAFWIDLQKKADKV